MKKNIIKIIIKTCFTVIFIGISLLFILVGISEDIDNSENVEWTREDGMRYDYENGNYDSIMYEMMDYDYSDKKFNDDWNVIKVYILRYDYDVCEKIYDETTNDEYLDKLEDIKEEMEECVDSIDDDYKKDVAKMFLEEIE